MQRVYFRADTLEVLATIALVRDRAQPKGGAAVFREGVFHAAPPHVYSKEEEAEK